MQVELTGRQITITKKIRNQVELGLERLAQLLARDAGVHIILTVEKYRHIAEVTVQMRDHSVVGLAETTDMDSALLGAIDKAEKQVLRHKNRLRTQKRAPKPEKTAPELTGSRVHRASKPAQIQGEGGQAPNGSQANGTPPRGKTVVPVVVHSFPSKQVIHEPHVVRSIDAVALRPMSLEEAVKEAEFRDREVFVFRDNRSRLFVLHRKRDGKMELIEIP